MLQLKALSEDDLAHYWRLYVDKLADLLAEADARPHGPAPDLARRVQSLQREALFLHIRQGPPHQSLDWTGSLTASCSACWLRSAIGVCIEARGTSTAWLAGPDRPV